MRSNAARRICQAVVSAAASLFAGQASHGATPILQYDLDETSGATANDSSGSGNTGSYVGSPTLGAAAPKRYGAYFSADNIYATGAASSSLNAIGVSDADFTVAFWVEPSAQTGGWRPLFHKGNTDSERGPGIWLNPGSNRIHFRTSTTSNWNEGTDSSADIATGAWTHVACVKAGNKWRCYVNGTLDTEYTLSGTTTGNSGPVYVGDDPWYAGSNVSMDDVRVYNVALTTAEVKQLCALSGHWPLNETSGTTAAEASPGGIFGTVVGTAAWGPAVRDNGLTMAGAGRVEIDTLLGSPPDFSLAAWVKITAFDTSGVEIVSLGDHAYLRATSTTITGGFYTGSGYVTVSYNQALLGTGWHHVVATFDDAANALKLYADGVLVATTTTSSSVSYAGLGSKIEIGAHGNGSTAYDLTGSVDDVYVYNKAFTLSEVADLCGLVGRWALNETSGTVAADSSGKALNGTYTNGPTVGQAGPYPGLGLYAPSFDGANDYVAGPTATNYSMSDGFSIAGWVYLNGYTSGAAILQNGSTTSSAALEISGTGEVTVVARSSGGLQTATSTMTLPTSKWKHVAATYDGTTFRVYIDGVLNSAATNAFTIVTPAGNLSIGAALESPAAYLNGRLQDVRLYNRAISPEEVAALYGLIGFWKLDEGSGTTQADSSGAGFNSSVSSGSPTWITTAPYKNGLQFNGASDDIKTSASFTPPSVGTVAFWMRPNGAPASIQRILGNGGDWEVRQYTDGIVYLDLCGDNPVSTNFTTVTTPTTANRWYHILGTFDSADDSYAVYVNGVLERSGTSVVNMVAQAANQLSFGTRTGTTERFAGALDDIRIYNRKVSASEIAEIYGLVGHWKFAEGAGTTAADSSGNGNNATMSGGTWTNNGLGDNAGDFNGTGGVASTATPFTPPSAGTVAFWLKASGPIAAGTQARLFGLGGDWESRQQPDGSIHFDLGASPYVGNEPFSTLIAVDTKDRWLHVAAVFDAADDSYKVYVNGELQASGVSPVDLIPQAAAILSFGTRTGSTEYWKGALRDFRIYNRKLSQADVMDLYGMIGWYKLDETSGTVATDSTGLGNHGTYTGSPTLNVPANGAASQGTAAAFNGSNYIQVAGLYDRTATASATAWARFDATDTSGADVISLGDHFRLRFNGATGGASVAYYNGSTYVTATASQILMNTGWHHYAAVLRNDAIKLYIDGVEMASTALSGAISYTGLGTNSHFASHGNGDTNYDFDGRLDDIRVYNRAMTPDQVYWLYHGSRINGLRILKWVETR